MKFVARHESSVVFVTTVPVVWQTLPVDPGTQTHVYVLRLLTHVAPFVHGRLTQLSITVHASWATSLCKHIHL